MFHVNDVRNWLRCPRAFWLARQSRPQSIRFLQLDEPLRLLGRKKLHLSEFFCGQRGDPNEATLDALSQSEWLCDARFEYEELRINIPFIHVTPSGLELYYLQMGGLPKAQLIEYYLIHQWVLENLKLPVEDWHILYFNPDYIRGEELDYDQLLALTDRFFNDYARPASRTIREHLAFHKKDYQPVIEAMRLADEENTKVERRIPACLRRLTCQYFEDCFGSQKVPDDSVLYLNGCPDKYDLYDQNIRHISEAIPYLQDINRQQYAQIMAAKNGGLFADRLGLKMWLQEKLVEPLSFLDFEWNTCLIPPYAGTKPNCYLLFQYSLDVINQKERQHYDFLGFEDCQKELVKKLLKDLPQSGSILTYGGDNAEKLRIRELAERFPDYQEPLLALCERIVDLSVLFTSGMIYDLRMRGNYSLKELLPLFQKEKNYTDLPIGKAMDAVLTYRELSQNRDPEKEQELLEYCNLDTYAMILMVEWLISLSKGETYAECTDTLAA